VEFEEGGDRPWKGVAVGSFLHSRAWVIPIVFAVVFGGAGWNAYRTLEETTRDQLEAQLQTLLDADVLALRAWITEHREIAEVHASNRDVRRAAVALLRTSRLSVDSKTELLASPDMDELRQTLAPIVAHHGFTGFGLIDRNGRFVAHMMDGPVGTKLANFDPVLRKVLGGDTVVTRPMQWEVEGLPAQDRPPLMLAIAPILGESGAPVAVLGFGINTDEDFSRILTVARMGASGETYAFDVNGLLVSQSRFDTQLREIGILPEDPRIQSLMHIEIRDPGGNLVTGYTPTLPLKARPLTRMAAEAVTGQSGVDVDGYRDYRGVSVAGAWTWIPELEIGITTEIDTDEAYAGLYSLQRQFWILLGLLVVASFALFFYSVVLVRLRNRVAEVRQLGRYRIERKIGTGGMGTVYLASHALLRRPTAIKILRSDRSTKESLARFEREVQVSSCLSHPNTIEIYDYGHTPDGVFYYAMEYLDGVTVGQCVEEDGKQPEARVVHVMKQACASIAEAHNQGLIHRDLKPANIMLCERGGLCDFVKVLDFGLVRPEERSEDLALTDVRSLTGTPLYLPPEAVQAPDTMDVRSDLYQLGAIAYFLLVGRHVFTGDSVYEVLAQHVSTEAETPSSALGRAVSPDLEKIILRCLEKDPNARPANASELLEAFESCEVSGTWTKRDAKDWWTLWKARHPEETSAVSESSQPTHPSGYTVDIEERLDPGPNAE
jgi:serine/threonine protein kinase